MPWPFQEFPMAADAHQTLDVNHAQKELAKLYQKVAHDKERVEITCDGSTDRCVIISKEELDSLERALEILADSDAVKSMRQSLAQVVAASQDGPLAAM